MEAILKVENLKKYYKENKAVNGLSFDLYDGEILGLLGPNGAGKSTTINILSTILKHDNGEIKFFGRNIKENKKWIKSQLGIVPQELAIFEDIPAYKNVEFFTSLYGLSGKVLRKAVLEALSMVGLEEKKDIKPITFSGGMKRRLNIACAIAHKPRILILDEPTVGIDPQSRNHILQSIKRLRDSGTTIIYTTHYMEEVEEIADRVIIMDSGTKIAEGTLAELMESYRNTRIYKIYIDSTSFKYMDRNKFKYDFFYEIEGIQKVVFTDNCFSITTIKEIENLDKIILSLVDRNLKISHITSEEGNLEMIFLKLTGKKLRD
ncbi:ATP-binding cassette domain-containing protein [Clostridium chromiireducens]|uniref:ATP-binding cassette domain-containing protein n=1 Tax=Clostridium chromiireducens TaxID=225345 RepID=A0A964W1C4_9CLOT|nr:ABC transporter ATP-binding protein [Clostridium chromiireducens]MVX63291.1 ATP-binding cassette domain-containing protein [Clostridium chromiireducens]